MFPRADLYTLVADPSIMPKDLRARPVRTSWLQGLPWRRQFRWGLPLFPWTIEQFRFTGYDLVISVSHTVAKGVRTGGVPHLCYCLTPMRYAWVVPEIYLGPASRWAWSPQGALVRSLRRWDAGATDRVSEFAAISQTVRGRIHSCYGRDAAVIFPPVDCDRFARLPRAPQNYWLVVSALVPYKRTDVAIEAFNRLRKPLVIVGTGPDAPRLRRLAGPTITFAGWQPPERLVQWYSQARAVIYPQEEDFGIAAVEAQAAGCPVVAFRQGGATETVRDGDTGIFFDAQTPDALADAVTRAEPISWDPACLRQQARRFDRPIFENAFRQMAAAVAVRGAP